MANENASPSPVSLIREAPDDASVDTPPGDLTCVDCGGRAAFLIANQICQTCYEEACGEPMSTPTRDREPPNNPVCDILMSASNAIMPLDFKGVQVYIDHCEVACQAYLELKRVISADLSQPKPCSTVIVGPTRQAALFAQAVSARVGVTKVLHLSRPTKALLEAACDLADDCLLILVTMDPTNEAAAIALGKCVRDAPCPHLFVFLTADGKLADSLQPLTRLDIPMPSQDVRQALLLHCLGPHRPAPIDLAMLVEQSDLLSFAEIHQACSRALGSESSNGVVASVVTALQQEREVNGCVADQV